MTGLAPYLLFDGTARSALEFYAETFGGRAELHTFREFDRDDGPPDSIAHGHLLTPHLSLYGADAGIEDEPFVARGIMLSLLGTADPPTLRTWFDRLSQGGSTISPLRERAWGASDGQLIDPLYGADAGIEDEPFVARGIMLSLLGTADPPTLRTWFDRLSQGGSTISPLRERAWGASDGQLIDRFGVHWLIGYEAEESG